MKFNYKYTPIALAVLTFGMSPTTHANDGDDNGDGKGSHASVWVQKEINYKQDVKLVGGALVVGIIPIDSSSAAIINDEQHNYDNIGRNNELTNSATIDGNAMSNASGNIGVNVTAGDSNQQANAAALSASDASFLFGSVDAEIVAVQANQGNLVRNQGNTNVASIGGDAFSNATGNIGVNVSSGNNNQQKNDLAAAVGVARMSTATVSVKQVSTGNVTNNNPIARERVVRVPVNLRFSANGQYAGVVDQNGDTYPDVWTGDSHPSGNQIGHVDLDDQVQGASDRPVSSGLDDNGNPNGDLSDGGALGFNEQGDIALSGSVTGFIPVVQRFSLATTNTSHLGDNAFSGAAGNIGVNIASGTNNQQYNGLAISATQAGVGGNGGSGGEF